MPAEGEPIGRPLFPQGEEGALWVFSGQGMDLVTAAYRESFALTAQEIRNMFGISRDIVEKEVYGPVETETGYAVIYIDEVKIPIEDYVEETMRSDYETDVKNEFFNAEASKWLSEADISINRELWDTIIIENAHK